MFPFFFTVPIPWLIETLSAFAVVQERVDESPFKKQDFIRGGEKAGKKVDLETMMPYTWSGLEAYLFENKIIACLDDYKLNSGERYTEYKGIIRAIGKVIYDRNFSGAAVNALNPNLIARQLGLAEKTQVEVKEQPLFSEDSETEE